MRMLLQLIRKSLDNYFLNDTFNLHHPWAILLGLVWAWLFGTGVRSPWMKQQHCVRAWEVFWGGMKGAPGLLQNMPLPHTDNCCSHSVQQHAQWATCSPNRHAGSAAFLIPREVPQQQPGPDAMHWWEGTLWRQCWMWIGGKNHASEDFQMVILFFFFQLHKTLKWRW